MVIVIILTVMILLAMLRFGVNAEYGSGGLTVKVKVGPLLISIIPRKKKKPSRAVRTGDKRKAKKHRKKRKKKKDDSEDKKKDEESEVRKPGGLDGLKRVLPPITKALGRFRRRFLIKQLTVIFTAAGTDASATASMYGNINAAIGILDPILTNNLRIKHRDFRARVDFMAQKSTVYVKAVMSLALWEVMYIALALLPMLLNATVGKNKKPDERTLSMTRKEHTDNG